MSVAFAPNGECGTSGDNLYNATNITFGFRLNVPSYAAIGDFSSMLQIGSAFVGSAEGGFMLLKHPTAGQLFFSTFSNGTEDGNVDQFGVAEAVWHSIVVKQAGSGAGTFNRFSFNHATATLSTNLADSATRSTQAGPICIGARQDVGGNGTGGWFEDFWISHTALSNQLCEMFVRGADPRFLMPHLLSYWPLRRWDSGTIADLVGGGTLTVTGTPTTAASPGVSRAMQSRFIPAAAPALPFLTQTKFQVFNDDGTGLGPPP